MYKFEWNEEKNLINIKKHNLSFEEAKEAFYDEYALIVYDQDHSDDEDRFYQIGMIKNLNIVTVIFCIRQEDTIRIISARYANKKEIEKYEEERV